MYRAAVRDGAKIDWQCPRCTDVHSDSFAAQESYYEEEEQDPGLDVPIPVAESTRIDVSGMFPSLKLL